jgi:ParB-like nuclease domain
VANPARGGASVSSLKPRLVRRDPAKLVRLPVNARFLRQEEYQRLVANIRRDGALTSVPLLYAGAGEYAEGQELILSGNHRCDAAVDAGLTDVDAMVIDEKLDPAQLVAIQLSHNAIAGEDDPATLKQLYEQIDDVDWRSYAGLDDKELALLDQVNLEGLSEANLDFQTVTVVFLPAELEAAKAAFGTAGTFADQAWMAAYRDYEPMLEALASVHEAHNVGNIATALGIILAVFESHLADLRAGCITPGGDAAHKGAVGLETVFGTRTVPAADAAVLIRAVRAAEKQGHTEPGKGWQVLVQFAETYLAGLKP